jgi:hypothetical protein
MGFDERVKAQIVPPDLLADVIAMHSNLDPLDRRDITEQMLRLVKTLHPMETAENKGVMGMAIHCRIVALSGLLRDGNILSKLIQKATNGAYLISPEVIQCTAPASIILRENEPAEFDEIDFVERYLKLMPLMPAA